MKDDYEHDREWRHMEMMQRELQNPERIKACNEFMELLNKETEVKDDEQ